MGLGIVQLPYFFRGRRFRFGRSFPCPSPPPPWANRERGLLRRNCNNIPSTISACIVGNAECFLFNTAFTVIYDRRCNRVPIRVHFTSGCGVMLLYFQTVRYR